MSHAAVIAAVCLQHQRLDFPPETPSSFVSLAEACMNHEARHRPSFDDVMEVLTPLAEVATSATAAAGGAGGGGGGRGGSGGGAQVN
jgi:hypothetical protein